MFKRELKRLVSLIGMAVIVVLILLYRDGWYDLSFIDRDYLNAADRGGIGLTDETTDKNPVNNDTEPDTSKPVSETAESANSELIPESETVSESAKKFRFTQSDEIDGDYVLTDEIYDKSSHILLEVRLPFSVPGKYSDSKRTEYDINRVYDTPGTEYRCEFVSRETEWPLIEPYMGYLFYKEGTRIHVLSGSGIEILSYEIGQYYPAYTRDSSDRPLFYTDIMEKASETEEPGNEYRVRKYYYIDTSSNQFAESDYIDARDGRCLYFDYPAGYGKSSSDLKRRANLSTGIIEDANGNKSLETTASYAYSVNESGGLYYRYAFAAPYSEGLAVTADKKNFVEIKNEYGQTVMGQLQTYRNRIRVTEAKCLVMPCTRGEESIGFFYFDHGLMRVREQAFDYKEYRWFGKKMIVHDKDMLIYADGSEFRLPYGYNLKAYSDGVALLEKDGRYGYFDYRQKWILDPVYTYAEPFREGLAAVGYADGPKGIINTDGEFEVPLRYPYISNCSSGVIALYDETDKWTIINKVKK